MTTPQPKFDAPPVVETALSLQFARFSGFSTAMAGWFWKSYLSKHVDGTHWTKVEEANRIEDDFEEVGKEKWLQPAVRLSQGESRRTRIIRSDEERMLQIQDSRVVLNWRKRGGEYPSYPTLAKEFWTIFPLFEEFAADAGFGSIEQNQWEITYVNHIPKGDLWQTPLDWGKIMPVVSFPAHGRVDMEGETLSSNWRLRLSPARGRLYVALRHALVQPGDSEVMELKLTARGPVRAEEGWSSADGFELGHDAIVRTFAAMTSAEAHKLWERRV